MCATIASSGYCTTRGLYMGMNVYFPPLKVCMEPSGTKNASPHGGDFLVRSIPHPLCPVPEVCGVSIIFKQVTLNRMRVLFIYVYIHINIYIVYMCVCSNS